MDPDLGSADSFLQIYRNEINAIGTLVVALLLERLVDRSLARRGGKLTAAVAGGELTPQADTRLRLVRRLISAAIIVVGVALALSAYDPVRRTAAAVLASSAVLGLVVGFAARQTLANAVAGILLAITQPIRIGDLVTFEDHTGTVEDVRLTYTYIRGGDGRRIIVPNERLAQTVIQNHTIVDPRVHVEVSLWLSRDADVQRALAVVADQDEVQTVLVADVERDGIRILARASAGSAADSEGLAARVRLASLERLRNEGLSSPVES